MADNPLRPSRSQPTAARTRPGENRVRIIGGRWRGRKLPFPAVAGLRPTGDRIRETLFNWLAPSLPGARCLDLFAGSGALGFEALSRGAAHCLMLEQSPEALASLRSARQLLDASEALIVAGDAQHWTPSPGELFDVVFLDPPFVAAELAPAMLATRLREQGALAPDALVYVEQPANAAALLPSGFTVHRERVAGQVRYSLWCRAACAL